MPETTTTIQTSNSPDQLQASVARCRFPQPEKGGNASLLVALGIQICGLLAALMVTIAPVQAEEPPYGVSLAPRGSFVVSKTPTAAVNFYYDLKVNTSTFALLFFNVDVIRGAVNKDGNCRTGVLQSGTTCLFATHTLRLKNGSLAFTPTEVIASRITNFPGYVHITRIGNSGNGGDLSNDVILDSGGVPDTNSITIKGTLTVTIDERDARALFKERSEAYIFVQLRNESKH